MAPVRAPLVCGASVDGQASALGGLGLNAGVASFVYAQHEHSQPDGTVKCFGRECYFVSWVVAAAHCFVGALVVVPLYYRTRPFYQLKAAANSAGLAATYRASDTWLGF